MVVSGLSFLVMIVLVMVSVGYVTLFERKLLSYSQRRKGPNKVGIKGLLQPISDAVKLFTKESFSLRKSSEFEFILGPLYFFSLALMLWWSMPLLENPPLKLFFVYFFCMSSFMGILIFFMGWVSGSKYSEFGAMRAISQSVSYEVVIITLSLIPLSLVNSFSCECVMSFGIWLCVWSYICSGVWYFTCLAELNRAPFDFVEGESELVSGFNVEYGGVGFALIFLGEYSMILFMSILSSIIIFGKVSCFKYLLVSFYLGFWVMLLVSTSLWIFLFIQARASYPRYRYDLLMGLCWKKFLPICLGILLIVKVF